MPRAILTALILAAAGAVLAAPARAADPEKGRVLARQCSACHGKNGIARDPEVANLAGQSAFYIEKALRDFREGRREDRRMTLIVERLSEEDMADLAAWYASFEVTVQIPE